MDALASYRDSPAVQTPLLSDEDGVVEGNVDYKGRQAKRSKSGGWLSASFVIGVEMAEFFAYFGVSANLITYLTGPLGLSTAVAAVNVDAWSGTCMLLPLLGAFVADSFLGRYRTVVIASVLYILALGLLAVSTIIPSSPSLIHIIVLFFFPLYLLAIAQGLYKPCVHAFGADQFDGSHREESKAKSSFFNWCAFCVCLAITFALVILTYVEENLSWGLGFGIPCIVMVFALVCFMLGTTTYRFPVTSIQARPFSRIARMFVEAAKNCRTPLDVESRDVPPFTGSKKFEFLPGSSILEPDHGSMEEGEVCSVSEIEEAKEILRLFPIWLSCLVYGIVFSQSNTLFTKQGLTMDRSIGSGLKAPAASLQSFASVTTMVFLPFYDRLFVPAARALTGKPSGITMLQRIGTGIFFQILGISVAAFVEAKRLETARECGLVELPNAVVPMSVAWLIPQYLLFGVSQSLAVAGLQEFFYDQMPAGFKSFGVGLYFTILGLGSLLSSILISLIAKVTGGGEGHNTWFSDNTMKGHLDYFYWLLTVISVVAFAAFVYFAKAYTYRKE